MNCDNKMNSEIFDINLHEKKIYSQNGEDGILEYNFSKIGTTNKISVEIGVGNGNECNTVNLLEKKGWTGLMMDYGADQDIQWKGVLKKAWSNKNIGISENIKKYVKFSKKIIKRKERSRHYKLDIKNERITAENIENLLQKYQVPEYFDLLSIDIDYNDFWVWKAISKFHPRVLVIEFNSSIPPTQSKVVPYDSDAQWDGTNYFGASLLALKNLSLEKNYTLLGCDSNGVNAFFCKSELIKNFKVKDIEDLYRSPKYGEKINGVHIGHPLSSKKMIEI
jgi:hypothetical protein